MEKDISTNLFVKMGRKKNPRGLNILKKKKKLWVSFRLSPISKNGKKIGVRADGGGKVGVSRDDGRGRKKGEKTEVIVNADISSVYPNIQPAHDHKAVNKSMCSAASLSNFHPPSKRRRW